MSSFFAKTNNYKDYFLSDNNGQSIPLASLILVPCVTLFLAYSTLVSKSDKNKENVTDNLDPINADEDDNDNDNDNETDTNVDDTNDSITNNNNDKKSPITITQGGKRNKKSKTTKKKSKKSKTIKKKSKKSKTIKKK